MTDDTAGDHLTDVERLALAEGIGQELYEALMEATADHWRQWRFLTDFGKETYRDQGARIVAAAVVPAVDRILAARAARSGQGEAVAAVGESWFREEYEAAKSRNQQLPHHGGMVVTGDLFSIAASTTAQDAEGGEVERLREFVRQRTDQMGLDPDLITTTWTDTTAEPAELRLSDLRAVLDRDTPNGGGE